MEETKATHCSILAWRIPSTEEPGGLYSPCGHKESDTTEVTYHAHMDGLRDSHQSEVSEREKQTLYINAYMWNLKKKLADKILCTK